MYFIKGLIKWTVIMMFVFIVYLLAFYIAERVLI